jgi:hypothetical protein
MDAPSLSLFRPSDLSTLGSIPEQSCPRCRGPQGSFCSEQRTVLVVCNAKNTELCYDLRVFRAKVAAALGKDLAGGTLSNRAL